MLSENYHKIASYLTETLGTHFIFLIFIVTTATSIAYFIVISYLITQMDKHYFLRSNTAEDIVVNHFDQRARHVILRYIVKATKTLVGCVLLVCGLAMLVLPGQGLLTILIGLSLVPFPGKHKLEQNLLARNSIRSSLNWIRIKAHKEPFIFD